MSDDRPSDDYRHIVRLDNVQKYFGAIQALKNINLAIGRTEIVGLIGDNGAGKSTLIKTLTGVMKPTSGRIFIRDREIDLDHYSVGIAHDLAIQTVYQDKSLGEKLLAEQIARLDPYTHTMEGLRTRIMSLVRKRLSAADGAKGDR